jgi:hypothetical protein
MHRNGSIAALEAEWEPESGFFWRIRQGMFVDADYQRALSKVRAISIPEDIDIPRRLVSLLWYIPLFMQWQMERLRDAGADLEAYTMAATAMSTEVERILGVP